MLDVCPILVANSEVLDEMPPHKVSIYQGIFTVIKIEKG